MAFYVYELIDPRTGLVFYVGKGKGARIDAHEKEARSGRISRKCDLIRAVEASGQKIEKRKVRTFASEQDAYDFEAELVESYGLANLTNVVPGGGTASGTQRKVRNTLSDRQRVQYAAMLMAWTKGGERTHLKINDGKPIDLGSFVRDIVNQVPAVIDRKGAEWVNNIASKWGVRFNYA